MGYAKSSGIKITGALLTTEELRDFEASTPSLIMKHKGIKGLSKVTKTLVNTTKSSTLDDSLISQVIQEHKISQQEKVVSEYFKNKSSLNKKLKSHSKIYLAITDNTLLFNSKFESGNLDQVYRITDTDYSLYLKPDTHNETHQTQWFYFSVRNISKGQKVVFTIKNLIKDHSLFNEGMRPWVFSTKKFQTKGVKWHRDWYDIAYYKNGEVSKVSKTNETSYEFFKQNKHLE